MKFVNFDANFLTQKHLNLANDYPDEQSESLKLCQWSKVFVNGQLSTVKKKNCEQKLQQFENKLYKRNTPALLVVFALEYGSVGADAIWLVG